MIDRREFVSLAALSGAIGLLPAFAGVFVAPTGRITGGGRPLKGVAVTDGLNVAKTDADGRFVLPCREGVRFVSVTVPSGWRTPCHYRVAAVGVPSYDFALDPWEPSAPGREVRFVHLADSEIYGISPKEKQMLAHVKGVADKEDAAFVIHTGDICSPKGLRAHIKLMNGGTLGRPTFYCVGNHDLAKEGAYGEWLFESLYGPSWYSFDAGGVHFCVTPMKGGDGKPSYTSESVAGWLKNDLAVVPKDRPVVLFNHSFWDGTGFDVKKIRDGVVKLGGFDVTAACNLTGLVFGHHHTNQFRRFGRIAAVQTSNPQMGGVDLSPATVRVVKVDGRGRLTSASHHAPCDTWPVVTQAEKGGWVAKLAGPVYFGTPVADGERVFVGTLDDDGLGTGSVTALDLVTGKVDWMTKTPNSVKNQLVIYKDLVIAQDGDGAVHAYDRRTGREVWTQDPKNATLRPHQFGLAVDTALGLVYCEIDLDFTALDAETGAVRWKCRDFRLYGTAGSRPVCGAGIVTGEIQWHGLYGCDAQTGKLLWRRDRKGPLGVKEQLRWRAGSVAVADGRVYATAGKGFRVLDAKTGETLQEKDYTFELTTTSTPLVTKNRIFVGSCNAGLVALDRATLDVAWQGKVGEALVVNGSYCKAPQQQVATAPVLADEKTVVATAGDGTVRFWDVASVRETRCEKTGAPHFAAPLVVGRCLVVADFAGYVRLIADGSGGAHDDSTRE